MDRYQPSSIILSWRLCWVICGLQRRKTVGTNTRAGTSVLGVGTHRQEAKGAPSDPGSRKAHHSDVSVNMRGQLSQSSHCMSQGDRLRDNVIRSNSNRNYAMDWRTLYGPCFINMLYKFPCFKLWFFNSNYKKMGSRCPSHLALLTCLSCSAFLRSLELISDLPEADPAGGSWRTGHRWHNSSCHVTLLASCPTIAKHPRSWSIMPGMQGTQKVSREACHAVL